MDAEEACHFADMMMVVLPALEDGETKNYPSQESHRLQAYSRSYDILLMGDYTPLMMGGSLWNSLIPTLCNRGL
jgi:hypothetical protein